MRPQDQWDWFQVWAVGRFDLRLNESDFWSLTPAQFFRLCKQATQEQQRADKRAGEIVAIIHNIVAKKPKNPSDWFPSLKPASRELTEDEKRVNARINQAKWGWAQNVKT